MRGPDQDMVLFESRDALRVFLGDHLNTIRDVVGYNSVTGNWEIQNHLTIDSFGRRTAESNGNIEVMIGLGGHPYDEVTRLQNHHNRWYSVAIERCDTLISLLEKAGVTLSAIGNLVHGALARRLVGPPAEKGCTVPESAAGEMIVFHFDDELWL